MEYGSQHIGAVPAARPARGKAPLVVGIALLACGVLFAATGAVGADRVFAVQKVFMETSQLSHDDHLTATDDVDPDGNPHIHRHGPEVWDTENPDALNQVLPIENEAHEDEHNEDHHGVAAHRQHQLETQHAHHALQAYIAGHADHPTIPGCGHPPLAGKTACDADCGGLAFVAAAGVCAGCRRDTGERITAGSAGALSPPAVWCEFEPSTYTPTVAAEGKESLEADDKLTPQQQDSLSHVWPIEDEAHEHEHNNVHHMGAEHHSHQIQTQFEHKQHQKFVATHPDEIAGCPGVAPLSGKSACDADCGGLAFIEELGICVGCMKGTETRIDLSNLAEMTPTATWCEGEPDAPETALSAAQKQAVNASAAAPAAADAGTVHTSYISADITAMRNQIAEVKTTYENTPAGDAKNLLGDQLMSLKNKVGPMLAEAKAAMKAEHDSHKTHINELSAAAVSAAAAPAAAAAAAIVAPAAAAAPSLSEAQKVASSTDPDEVALQQMLATEMGDVGHAADVALSDPAIALPETARSHDTVAEEPSIPQVQKLAALSGRIRRNAFWSAKPPPGYIHPRLTDAGKKAKAGQNLRRRAVVTAGAAKAATSPLPTPSTGQKGTSRPINAFRTGRTGRTGKRTAAKVALETEVQAGADHAGNE